MVINSSDVTSITVPEDASAGHIVRHEGTPIGVVLSIQEDGRARVQLAFERNEGVVANVPMDGENLHCEDCNSEKIHHDRKEEWVCPFCEL